MRNKTYKILGKKYREKKKPEPEIKAEQCPKCKWIALLPRNDGTYHCMKCGTDFEPVNEQ